MNFFLTLFAIITTAHATGMVTQKFTCTRNVALKLDIFTGSDIYGTSRIFLVYLNANQQNMVTVPFGSVQERFRYIVKVFDNATMFALTENIESRVQLRGDSEPTVHIFTVNGIRLTVETFYTEDKFLESLIITIVTFSICVLVLVVIVVLFKTLMICRKEETPEAVPQYTPTMEPKLKKNETTIVSMDGKRYSDSPRWNVHSADVTYATIFKSPSKSIHI